MDWNSAHYSLTKGGPLINFLVRSKRVLLWSILYMLENMNLNLKRRRRRRRGTRRRKRRRKSRG
jgi:hypothetical protein